MPDPNTALARIGAALASPNPDLATLAEAAQALGVSLLFNGAMPSTIPERNREALRRAMDWLGAIKP